MGSLEFPAPPTQSIDWTDMRDFNKVYEVNGHIESNFSVATGKWSPLKFVRDPYIHIHGMSPALNYGQQVLEGLKAFRMPGHPGNIAVFRPDRNALRLQHSAEALSMPAVPVDMFVQACRAATALNAEFVPPYESGGALYIRPQLYGSGARLAPSPADEYVFSVFVIPQGGAESVPPVKALIQDRFDRAAPNGVGHAKVGGNYAPCFKWSAKAKADGFGLCLHLDSKRHEEIDEFSTCGFIGIRCEGDDVSMVIPDSPSVINSVTSDSFQQLAVHNGWKLEKRTVPYQELASFTEVFGAGTGLSLVPVRSITRHREGADSDVFEYISPESHQGGPVYHQLSAQLRAIQTGRSKDVFGWRAEISADDLDVESRRAWSVTETTDP